MAALSQVKLLDMAREVLLVTEEYSLQDIIKDLTISQSAEATINRIFDGQFLKERTPEPELPPPSHIFRSLSPERPVTTPRPINPTFRFQSTSTSASASISNSMTSKSTSSVVVILSSDEEDNVKTEKPDNRDGFSDSDDGFDRLMKNIQLRKTEMSSTTSRLTHGISTSSSSSQAGISTYRTPAITMSPRKRTALSPPLILSNQGSPSLRRDPISPTLSATRKPAMASSTKTRINGEESGSTHSTNTERAATRSEEIIPGFTEDMPLSFEVCPEWNDPPFLQESPSPPPKSETTPNTTRVRPRSPIFESKSLSATPPLSPSKRAWALSRSPSPGFMLRLSNSDSSRIGNSSSIASSTRIQPVPIKKYRSPSPLFIRRSDSTEDDKKNVGTEDSLRQISDLGSPVSRYSDEAWLKRVKAEKQTDRALDILSRKNSAVILDDDDYGIQSTKKDEHERVIGSRTIATNSSSVFDDDEGDDSIRFSYKKKDNKSSANRIPTSKTTDVFDESASNKWSAFDDLLDESLSPPRTLQDDDADDPILSLDEDIWSGNLKRSRSSAGLASAQSLKDPKKHKPTKSGIGAASTHFDLNELDDYRDDVIVLDDDIVGQSAIELEVAKRAKSRQQRKGKAKLDKIENQDLDNTDDSSNEANPRQRKRGTKANSDVEFNDDDSDGSDTLISKKSAKEKAKLEAKLKREAAQREKQIAREAKKAEKAEKDARRAADKELERSEKEARLAEKKAESQNKANELLKKKREREEERLAKLQEAEAAKQAERELRIANRLTSKSQSAKEIVLCMEESMFDSELGVALQSYLKAIDCHIDLLKSPVTGAIAVAEAAAAYASRPIGAISETSESSMLSDLNGTNDACPIRDLIFWRRIVKHRWSEQLELNVALPEEEHTVELETLWLCHMTAKEFCDKIKQKELYKFLDSVTKDMRTRLRRQKARQEAMGLAPTVTSEDRSKRQRVVFMIMGMSDHLRGLKLMTTRSFQEAVLANMRQEYGGGGGSVGGAARAARATIGEENSGPSQEEIDHELMELQLQHDCLIIHTDDYEESAQVIVSLTEQISQRPYKVARKSGINVCVDGIRSAMTYEESYIKGLEQIHMVTNNVARSIAEVYPTYKALYDAYKKCSSVYEGMGLLERIQINGKRSYLGKALSKRIYEVLMGENPDMGIS
ncbi:hypothetical protein FBU30_005505 [Linnemannia zychae]|nr:hypothetical protein FBU30_005505 [Linnemannia zychae]